MVTGHLNVVDMEQGNEAVSEIDLTKLTDLAKRQLRGALGVQEPSNPQLASIEQTLAAMKLQMDGLAREMQVIHTHARPTARKTHATATATGALDNAFCSERQHRQHQRH